MDEVIGIALWYVAPAVVLLVLLRRSVNIVQEWERRPVLRFGRYIRTLNPGIGFINPITHKVLDDVLVSDQIEKLTIENTQTHDNVPMSFVFALTYRVLPDRVRDYVVNLTDADEWQARAVAAANEKIGARTLDHVLNDRDALTSEIRKSLQQKVSRWGLEIEALEIEDFSIRDEDIQNSIAMKARAKKEAEGELTRAEMQQEIAERLNVAAQTLDENGWRLKGLETLIELCRSAQNNTILLPTELGSLVKSVTGR